MEPHSSKPLSYEERDTLKTWNDWPAVPESADVCIHHLIAAKAATLSNRTAVYAWDGELTYGELDELSTRLAHYLSDRGIGPEVLVPLCFEKSLWTTVAMLAVLKTGGAFVLLDISQPEMRLRSIVSQTESVLILSSSSNTTLSSKLSADVVIVGRDLQDQRCEAEVVLQQPDPSSPMYVVFTSGSTGTPKGVVVSHASFCSALHYQLDYLGITPSSRVFEFASYSFDVAIHSSLATLAAGGCVCIPSEMDRRQNLASVMARMKATFVNLTPSVARLVDPQSVPTLKTIILLGEAITTSDVERWWSKVRVINAYGLRECTTLSTINWAASTPLAATRIGRGRGVITWVVHAENHNTLLPPGEAGELLLEGPILARGYLNDAEKTAAAFIEDPPWLVQGTPTRRGRRGRLYKTGDLVRYNEDGSLSFVGRKDMQVTIHGQRVELGEVEHHVQACMPQAARVIAEAVTLGEERDNPILAAFLCIKVESRNVSQTNETATEGAMRLMSIPSEVEEKIAERLPGPMMPQVYFALGQLPMTLSGKTDRKRLREIGSSFTAEQLAEQLAEIGTSIGLDDGFFRLGGDSITVVQVVGEARKAGIELAAAADVFRYPKLIDLASAGPSVVDTSIEEIAPFPLLDASVDLQTLRGEVAACYNLDATLIEDIYPCTPFQEGLLSLPSKSIGDYVLRSVLELSLDVQLDAFCAAWEETVHSTALLRTRVIQHSQVGLVQVVLREGIQWKQADELEAYLEEDKLTLMDLGQPLTRYALVRDGASNRRWFVWTIHHALYDRWSLPLVLDTVSCVYHQRPVGQQWEFKTFVKYLQDKNSDDAEAYWQSVLADVRSVSFPPLPLSVQTPTTDITVEHPCRLFAKKESNITTSTLIYAAWAVVVSGYTSSADVIFGTTVSGRNAPVAGIEDMVGPTIATIPVRVRVAGGQSVSAYLEELQNQATERIPYEQTGLQRISRLGPDAQNACGFQTLLVVQPTIDDFDNDDALGVWWERSGMQAFPTYALTLQCIFADEDLKVVVSFDSKVIERWKVDKILRSFSYVMTQLAEAGPEQTVADVILITPQDMEELQEWNKTMPVAVEACVHDLIQDQARTHPSSPAICAWDGELTYGELDMLATRLTHHLRELGVGPEVIVPLCFEKSLWTVVAMLAVLKAGGAFLLLDPSHPVDRLRMLCDKVSATIAIASRSSLAKIDCCDRTVIILDSHAACQLPLQEEPIQSAVGPTNVAYLIFTSGSTGEPKGCKIEHLSYCSAALGHGPTLGMCASTRALQFGSYSFAGAIMETLMTLIHGGCVCIPSEQDRMTGLADTICKLGANWAFLTSSVLASLKPESVPSLAHICVGGEPIQASQIGHWAEKVCLRQTYGSAETSAVVSSARLSLSSSTSDVGKAATGRYWIVEPSDASTLVPLGAVGELLIEGPVIGREYLNEPERTLAVFIDAPSWRRSFGQRTTGSRFYKSGDLAVYKSDGSIEILGRKDTQVKIRGQRIELGEIEHHIRQSASDIRDVVVELIKHWTGHEEVPLLMGFFVVGRKGKEWTESTDKDTVRNSYNRLVSKVIQEQLEKVLPHYMVPSIFVPLEAIPLTISGKTDRKRLREIGSSFSAAQLAGMRTTSQGPKRQPMTEVEQQLQRLWARVLSLDPKSIGLDDSFFHLGGDSIFTIKLVGEARKAGIELTAADVFHHPKLVDMVQFTHRLSKHVIISPILPPFSLLDNSMKDDLLFHLDSLGAAFNSQHLVNILPVTPFQQAYLTHEIECPQHGHKYFFLDLGIYVDVQRLKESCQSILTHFPILRAAFIPFLGKFWQVILRNFALPFHTSEVDEDLQQASYKFCLRDVKDGFQLGSPRLSFMLIRNQALEHRLIVRISHAQYDGISLPIIIRSLMEAYQEKPLGSFSDFSLYLSSTYNRQSKAISYWRDLLKGSRITNITSKLRCNIPPYIELRQIQASTTIRMPQLLPGITIATLVSAAWSVALSQITGDEDVVYGHLVAGRNANVTGIEEIVGPCLNIIPVRAKVSPECISAKFLLLMQEQSILLADSDSLGLPEVVRHCTDWPAESEFDSIVQHQNIDEHPEFQIAGVLSRLQWFENPYAVQPNLRIFTRPQGDQLLIEVLGSSRIINVEAAERLLNSLCKIIAQLATEPHIPLSSCKSHLSYTQI